MTDGLSVAVLMGGPSGEHDISLKSGHGIEEALRRRQFHVEPVVIPRALTIEQACAFTREALAGTRCDVVFIALHGPFGEDGTMQQLCEDLHLPYTGSDVASSRLGMDKAASRKRFERAGLAVPRWRLVDGQGGGAIQPPKGWAYPLVVKPSGQGSSLGVSVAQDDASFDAAVATARRYGPAFLIEEFVQGRELAAGVLGDDALPLIEIRPSHPFFDYSAKYTAGMTNYLVPAPLPEETARAVQQAALTAHRAIGCRHLSRADVILRGDGTPVILEVNTIPGFTATSLLPKAAAAVGVTYDSLCEQLVMMAAHPAVRT